MHALTSYLLTLVATLLIFYRKAGGGIESEGASYGTYACFLFPLSNVSVVSVPFVPSHISPRLVASALLTTVS